MRLSRKKEHWSLQMIETGNRVDHAAFLDHGTLSLLEKRGLVKWRDKDVVRWPDDVITFKGKLLLECIELTFRGRVRLACLRGQDTLDAPGGSGAR